MLRRQTFPLLSFLHRVLALQLAVWSMLRELNVGASLQHYNPVIDARVKEIFDIPENFKLVAQMPFGGIVSEPDKKEKEDIDKRVTVLR